MTESAPTASATAWNIAWSADEGASRVQALFSSHFDGPADGVWSAPGRVNLIDPCSATVIL